MESYASSHIGYERKNNEDNYIIADSADGRVRFYVVSDGMGGYQAGEVASEITTKDFAAAVSEFRYKDNTDLADFVENTLTEIDKKVRKQAVESETCRNMGATFVMAAVIDGKSVVFGNVGDSRGYVFSEGKLTKATHDHSMVQQLIEMGCTEKEARQSVYSNSITRAVGYYHRIPGIHPVCECCQCELADGDMIMLCSDGLSSYAANEEIEKVFIDGGDPKTMCETLTELALKSDSVDDITIMIIKNV